MMQTGNAKPAAAVADLLSMRKQWLWPVLGRLQAYLLPRLQMLQPRHCQMRLLELLPVQRLAADLHTHILILRHAHS